MRRLNLAAIESLPEAVRPPLDPRGISVGIVHLGLGAFHRAHQAVYTQAAMLAAADTSWGICGVSQRSRGVLDQLAPQDGLYSVIERDDETHAHVLVPLRALLLAQQQSHELVERIAAPSTRVITLTVTEKGYRHDPASGRLDTDDVDIRADAAGRPPRTVVGQLVAGLQQRQRLDGGPITVVCCDNLARNGQVLRQLVADFCALSSSPAATWIADNVRFPCTMVDRIVPATTRADLQQAAQMLGVEDLGAVVTESFSQWVIEDDFAASRPAWEAAGALVVPDVSPYEAIKLRLLNGSHSALGYLGALAGVDGVAEFVARDEVATYLRALMDVDVSPTLEVPSGLDLAEYKARLMRRFRNRALGYRTTQIATDGSQKLPPRLLGTIRDRLAQGANARFATLAVASWMRYVSAGRDETGRPIAVDDPMAARFAQRLANATTPEGTVDALLGMTEIFGEDLRGHREWRGSLVDLLTALATAGVAATLRDVLA